MCRSISRRCRCSINPGGVFILKQPDRQRPVYVIQWRSANVCGLWFPVVMGQYESQPYGYKMVKEDDGNFVFVSNDPECSFNFEPSDSHMVSYGIDVQTSDNFKQKTLGAVTASDAQQVLHALTSVGAIPQQNSHLFSASADTDDCTIAGIKRTFQEQARKVGPNGLFVFHFSGHGIKVRTKEWGLAPVDFDYTRDTYLTATLLSEWLNEVQCKARHILFTLDCCYAGGIAKELTSSGQVAVKAGLYVISACTAYESSLVLGSLGHSIFTYFLSLAIRILTTQPGVLPMREIFRECQTCCTALSSLLITYSSVEGLKWNTMQPQLGVLDLRSVVMEMLGEGQEQIDASKVGRFQFAVELYDQRKPVPALSDKCTAWLESLRSTEGPLIVLEKCSVLTGHVLDTALCSMMYSIASIELACNTATVSNPNHSITAFMHVVSAIDLVHRGVEFSENKFYLGWLFYLEALKGEKVAIAGLKKLHLFFARSKKFNAPLPMTDEARHRGGGEGRDFTDAPSEMEVCK